MAQPKIALVGNLANLAYEVCKFLRRQGVYADLFVYEHELAQRTSNPENHDPGVLRDNPPAWLKIVNANILPAPIRAIVPNAKAQRFADRVLSKRRLKTTLREYDLIASFCLAPWFVQSLHRPYVSFSTGSDLRELAVENSAKGHHAASIFQHAQLVFFGVDPGSLEAVRRLGLKNAIPHRLPMDTDFFSPAKQPRMPSENEMVIFHPANLDWTDRSSGRWTKGNDKLFRAFARLVGDGTRSKLIYLERGPDVDATRRLVKELEIESHVVPYKGDMTRAQLRDNYCSADIVADQFSTAAFGQITMEAMSCGSPVMVNMDLRTVGRFYEEPPPVLACSTEEEIHSQLKLALMPDQRAMMGNRAREWVMKYHDWKVATNRLVLQLGNILGRPLL